jgi:hypothetical protein
MKALIVGMGFGNLYKGIYSNRGDTVVTVDVDSVSGRVIFSVFCSELSFGCNVFVDWVLLLTINKNIKTTKPIRENIFFSSGVILM